MDPQTRAALTLVVQDRDQAQLLADNRALGRFRRDSAAAELVAYNLVLATFAGALGYSERRRLELALATGTDLANVPAPEPGPDDPTDEDEPQPISPRHRVHPFGRPEPGSTPYVCTTCGLHRSEGLHPEDYDVTASAMADRPVVAPMGGWEPRS